jgi:hypothetical protein
MDAGPLSRLPGDWTVEWHWRVAPGEFAVSTARAGILLDLEDCTLIERFDGTLRGTPFSAVTLISRPGADVYDRVRIDTEHGRFQQSAGAVEDGAVVFTSERDLGSRVLRTRHVFSELEADSFRVEFFMSPRDEAPWELVHKALYRREGE